MRFSRFSLPLLALCLIAAARQPSVTIRFHSEVNPKTNTEFSVSVPLPDSSKTICLSKIPEISEGDVKAVFPFPANDGTQGCALKLDEHGRLTLDTLSQQSRGSMFVGFLNKRPVAAMIIDRHVTDGILVIPRGLTPEEIALLQKTFPTLGAKKNKKGEPKASPSAPVRAPAPAPAALLPLPALPMSPEVSAPAPRGD